MFSRMRNVFVTPLQGKLSARIEYVNQEIEAASTTSARTKLQKPVDILKKNRLNFPALTISCATMPTSGASSPVDHNPLMLSLFAQ